MEVHEELAKNRSLTLYQLWAEYIERNPHRYRYNNFCELYRAWRGGKNWVLYFHQLRSLVAQMPAPEPPLKSTDAPKSEFVLSQINRVLATEISQAPQAIHCASPLNPESASQF